MENRSVDVPESHFKDLLKYWNSDPHKKMSETNTENRNKLKCPHTAGRTSFALIREAKKKEISDTSDTLSSKDIFVAARKRKLGQVYKSSYDNTISKIMLLMRGCSRKWRRGCNKECRKVERTKGCYGKLDSDMLRFSARSPVEASSAQQAAVQLNNRLFAGTNNQGGVDQEMKDEGSEELDHIEL